MSNSGIEIVFVEDDEMLREATAQALSLEGFNVTAFADAVSALETISPDYTGVIVSDVRLPVMDGIEFFDRLQRVDADLQVIFTTAHGDVDMAVRALQGGAADFFTKPYSIGRLTRAIRNASEKRALLIENRKLREELRGTGQPEITGSSAQAERLRRTISGVAQFDTDLLISGPTGSGKSFVSRLIHEASARQGRPFVVIDAAILLNKEAELILYGRDPSVALSRSGLIERANGGTLVLEDIDRIPEAFGKRLASLLDTRRFFAIGAERPTAIDLRVIGTIGTDGSIAPPSAIVSDRALFERLSGVGISLPPLAERREDIPEMFRAFVQEFESETRTIAGPIGDREWYHLLKSDWPGNVRELRQFARNFVLGLTDVLAATPVSVSSSSLRQLVSSFEKTVIEDALKQADGRIGDVQVRLDIPRKTLYDKMSKYGIKPRDYRQ